MLWATAVVGANVGPVQAGVPANHDLLGEVSTSRWFSPNGDGSKDAARISIYTASRARVTVTVRHERKGWVARRVTLRSRAAGARVWSWNGRNDNGRVVVDGNYVVTVDARDTSGTDRDTTRIKSRRNHSASAVESPELALDRTTAAAGGTVGFTARQVLEIRNAFGRDRSRPVLTAVTIYADSGGAAVAATFAVERDVSDPVRVGTARAPGTYSVVAHFVDSYGNTGTSARRVTVTPDTP